MVRRVFVAMLILLWPGVAGAGEPISLQRDASEFGGYTTSYPCSHVFTGEIEPGDAGKIEASESIRKLCLNSEGGDLDEALKMVRFLRERSLGTRIREGERCEGACAWVFMAGSGQVEEGFMVPDRTMHPLARLAFTRPGSNGAEPENSAYGIAQAQIADLLRELFVSDHHADPRPAKPGLLAEVLEMSPGEALVIDTVDKAGRNGIVVSPIQREVRPDKLAFIRACDNAGDWAVGASALPAWEQDWADHYVESESSANALEVELYLAPEYGPRCKIYVDLDENGTIKRSHIEAGVKATYERSDNALFYQHPEMRLKDLAGR